MYIIKRISDGWYFVGFTSGHRLETIARFSPNNPLFISEEDLFQTSQDLNSHGIKFEILTVSLNKQEK